MGGTVMRPYFGLAGFVADVIRSVPDRQLVADLNHSHFVALLVVADVVHVGLH